MKLCRYIVVVCVIAVTLVASLRLLLGTESVEDFYRRYARHDEWSVTFVEQFSLGSGLRWDSECMQAPDGAEWERLPEAIIAEMGFGVPSQVSGIVSRAEGAGVGVRRRAMSRTHRRSARHEEWSVTYVEQHSQDWDLKLDAVLIQAHDDAGWGRLCEAVSAETGCCLPLQGSSIVYKAKDDATVGLRQAMSRYFVSNSDYRCICVYYIANERQRRVFQSIGQGHHPFLPNRDCGGIAVARL